MCVLEHFLTLLSHTACLRKIAREANCDQPDLLLSTRLRKHIGVMTQLVSLEENELDLLATYMGHDLRIHRDFYRLPENTLQIAKVSKILLMMEKGTAGKYKGQKLDDIDISLETDDEDKETPPHPDENAGEENPPHLNEVDGAENYQDSVDGAERRVADENENAEHSDAGENEDAELSKDEANGAENLAMHPLKVKLAGKKKSKQEGKEQNQRKRIIKIAWSSSEKEYVRKKFEKHLKVGTAPGVDACEEAQVEFNLLKRRKWSHIKDFVIAEYRRMLKRKPL